MDSERDSHAPPDDIARDAIRETFDWSETDPSNAVVKLVAADLNRDPLDIESLYERVDPDALDAIVTTTGTDTDRSTVTVSFTYADRFVTVDATGTVVVRPVDVG
ncbi:hypothetical protein G9C85_10350 [Halorubellus sp. JP-L1]|uniref:HalOD1 output domain-containing protein n=1 Tax=Halorubellus sp. JP-L1 TaxID=2715753 RepID=UPI00140DEC60|nr:HalOD1 output domain-containing protein [Halorubellus sp. JP-L1]NHN42027.1 hypothetical protein [Halorubellus sp. JP-L1]